MVTLSEKLNQSIERNPFFLAPMAGITDKPFRSFMKEMGCGILTTELVSARALKEKASRSLKIMEFDPQQRPVGIQIFGDDASQLAEGAQKVCEAEPDFIELNLGCPVNKIVKKGAGSALLKDLKKLRYTLNQIKTHSRLPVSLKVRTGWDESQRNAEEVADIAYEEGYSWMTIHGRTRAQGYSGQADWEYIKKVKSKARIPIIGNGDIKTSQQAVSRLKESGCDGVMIGRGALRNPWIFLESLALLQGNSCQIERNPLSLFKKLQFHLENFYPERFLLLQMKKFCSWFSTGYPLSSQFRRDLFAKKTREELLDFVHDYFEKSLASKQDLVKYESFLMRGHG